MEQGQKRVIEALSKVEMERAIILANLPLSIMPHELFNRFVRVATTMFDDKHNLNYSQILQCTVTEKFYSGYGSSFAVPLFRYGYRLCTRRRILLLLA